MPFVNAGGQTPPSTLNNPSGTQGIDLSNVPSFMRQQFLDQINAQMRARQQMTNAMQGSGLQNVGVQSPFTSFKAYAPPGFATAPGFGTAQANDATANANQNALVAALTNQAAGRGPSVAQGMLNQATQQNIANVASGVAGNRSLSPAEAARIQLEGGVQAQGQAAGQAATMRAQEQLGAQGLLGNVLAGQRGQDIATQQALGQLQLGQGAQNLQAQGMNEQAQLANLQANLAQQGINIQQQGQNQDFWGRIAGGALTGLGAVGGFMVGGPAGAMAGGALGSEFAGGGSPADVNLGGQNYGDYASGLAGGGMIPGKARKAGDSPRNDTVSAKLSPGEIVLPRHVTLAEDAPERAAEFVRAIRRKKMSESGEGYGKVLEMRRTYDQGGTVYDHPVSIAKEGETQQVRPGPAPVSPDLDLQKLQHMLAILKAVRGQ